MSRVSVLLAVASLLAAGCGSSIGNPARLLPCTPSNNELDQRMVLMAQSVPTASAVPCMRAELDDWYLDDMDSRDGHTRIEFSRLVDQVALTIELTRTCDHGAASETATDQPGTRRFDERIRTGSFYRDRRFYLLPGACVTYEFALTGAGTEEAAEEVSGAIGFVSRDQLADQVRRYSGGRLQLDPERPRGPSRGALHLNRPGSPPAHPRWSAALPAARRWVTAWSR